MKKTINKLDKLPIDEEFYNAVKHSFNMYSGDTVRTNEYRSKVFKEFLERANIATTQTCDDVVNYIYFHYLHTERPYNPSHIVASKHKNGRAVGEKQKRSTDHFKETVLPFLPREDKIHFAKKFSKEDK